VDYEGNPFHDYFRELPFLALKKRFVLDHQSVLVASCGNGIDIHYLRKHFDDVRFHASDISESAVTLAMKTFNIDGSVQDNEHLSFADDTFDYSFVAASLHHLLRPHQGLYELLRVSRKGVIAIEPNDCWLTRLAVRLNLATEYERDTRNYVFRYSKKDVEKVAKAMFCEYKVIRMFAIHRIARSVWEYRFLRLLNRAGNAVVPSLGNYIIFAITKERVEGGEVVGVARFELATPSPPDAGRF
jgi:ubiquinone/menaquinone biosynthesis C-methylase UbiE